MAEELTVRSVTDADLAAVARISAAAGQAPTGSGIDPHYVARLRETGRVAVATDRDGVVGWGAVTAAAHGQILSDLFVDVDARGRGVGAAVLGHLWPDPAAPGRLTFSSQDPRALPLYARAGLVPRWPLLYLSGDPRGLAPARVHVETVSAAVAADAEAGITGVVRTSTYRYWLAAAPAARAVVLHEGRGLVGVGVVAVGELTHLAVTGEADPSDVLLAGLQATASARVRLCLPGPHPALRLLLEHGFRVNDHDTHLATPDVVLPPTWVYSPGLA